MPQRSTLDAPLGDYIQVLTGKPSGTQSVPPKTGELTCIGVHGRLFMCVCVYTCVSVCVHMYAYTNTRIGQAT